MTPTLLLNVTVALVATLGTALLGLGERDPTLALAAFAISSISVYATDHRGWFKLHPWVANTAGLTAVLGTAYAISRQPTGEWPLTIAHLLSYLEFILLFQQKTGRHVWLLLMLSLLQVAVACALNFELLFGFLLAAYVISALLCLHVFFGLRERQRFEPPSGAGGMAPDRRGARLGTWQPGVLEAPDDRRVGWGAFRFLGKSFAFCGLVTVLIFVFFPRIELRRNRWGQSPATPDRHTGFSDQVGINDLGTLLEDRTPILKLRLYDEETGFALPPLPSLRLRGASLTHYAKGLWKRDGLYATEGPPFDCEPPATNSVPLVRQVIDLEPLDSNVLFGICPWAAVEPRQEVQMQHSALHLIRPPSLRGSKFRYELLTWGIRDGIQLDRFPNYIVVRWQGKEDRLVQSTISPEQYHQLTRLPREADGRTRLPRLTALARGKAAALPWPRTADNFLLVPGEPETPIAGTLEAFSRFPEERVLQLAQSLEDFLKNSPDYVYSLKAVPVDGSLDPVEDFLINRKAGHCEYYASALVLMLRSHGVPARLVSGFGGAEWNPLGGFYQLRQNHAHSWVECYLPDGTWQTLDPTPSREGVGLEDETEGWYARIRPLVDALDFVWTVYVLGLDSYRQQREVYHPVQRAVAVARGWWPRFGEASGTTGEAGEALEIPWVGLLGGALILGGAMLLFRRRPAVKRAVVPADDDDPFEEARRAEKGLFEDLERVLSRHDLRRIPSQTPRDFARLAAVWLACLPGGNAVAPVPRRIVEAFYRVRFGGLRLSPREFVALRSSLSELQTMLDSLAAGAPLSAVDGNPEDIAIRYLADRHEAERNGHGRAEAAQLGAANPEGGNGGTERNRGAPDSAESFPDSPG